MLTTISNIFSVEVHQLAKLLNKTPKQFQTAGTKDRRAITTQRVPASLFMEVGRGEYYENHVVRLKTRTVDEVSLFRVTKAHVLTQTLRTLWSANFTSWIHVLRATQQR